MLTQFSIPSRQRGAVLIISLVILVAMTLVGTVAIRNTVLEERMAGNWRDQTLAFQAAEAALREAEYKVQKWYETSSLPDFTQNNNGLYVGDFQDAEGDASDDALVATTRARERNYLSVSWWKTGTNTTAYTGSLDGISSDLLPRYVIERLDIQTPSSVTGGVQFDQRGVAEDGTYTYFRITAVSAGGIGEEGSIVILQSMYSIPGNNS